MTQTIETRLQTAQTYLDQIAELDCALNRHFEKELRIDRSLTRQLVSFQANKGKGAYRWYKYKEAFSSELVQYLLQRYDVSKGTLLDPFAGVGTCLFAAAGMGYSADGIELLAVGQEVIDARMLADAITADGVERLKRWRDEQPWRRCTRSATLNELRITQGAYPHQTGEEIGKYLIQVSKEQPPVSNLLKFALLCILEAISFTRKDGQYLRWDSRSGRRNGQKQFDKGHIPEFKEAIVKKLDEIIFDLGNRGKSDGLFAEPKISSKTAHLFKGSSLDILPTLKSGTYSAIFTSPPYCNRYDYTRTYALELAMLGVTEEQLAELRQKMLSCTVENRPKDLLQINPHWQKAIAAADGVELLQTIRRYLEYQRCEGKLNNPGIARMVKGYFYEMACVLQDCYRVLRPNGFMFMVNDNVRYAGASISVDLILSSIAESLGFTVEAILVLPQGKGNSSQQMGQYGRDALRKCVYVWRKPA